MTTHGAKGLEAPIVILPDTGDVRPRQTNEVVQMPGGLPVWKPRSDLQPNGVRDALTIERARDEVKAGVSLGAVSSWFKFFGTELNKQRNNLLMDIHGGEALAWTGDASNDGKLARDWLRTKGNSIEGGTSEIQLNIVAKHILGLPG